MPTDLTRLIGMVKASKLFTDAERKEWLQKMETMDENQLGRLQDILIRGEQLDWEAELPKYEAAMQEAGNVIQQPLFI